MFFVNFLARKLRTVSNLPNGDRRLLITAIAFTALVRISLCLVPFRRVKVWAESPSGPLLRLLVGKAWGSVTAEKIGWAVRISSRYIPAATCLTQALTAQILLNGAGIENAVHIGVTLRETTGKRQGEFGAHAWVEHMGAILVGGAEQSSRYARILTLPGVVKR
jgi:hypothetical protein